MRQAIGILLLSVAHRLLRAGPGHQPPDARVVEKTLRDFRQDMQATARSIGEIDRRLKVLERPRRIAARLADEAVGRDAS